MKKLPQRFLDDMKELLRDEYDDFIKSYEEPKTTGLRVNTLKISKEELLNLDLYNLTQIPWAEEGFYYNEEVDRPGKSPLHESGAYYLQEPSAMSVVPHLDIQEGDKVLDMCAAPGGKSTYILSKLNDTGLLVSNEINPTRIRALGENLERFGARNCIITNTDSNNLRKVFTGYFDKIVIDAPCSGQGMFRKDEVAITDWSYAKVLECQSIQKEIIRDGYDMLNNGGILVYSTCTFAKEENEDVINEFISEYKDAKLIEMQRIWPHKVKGEGHFVAKIQKLENEDCNVKYIKIKNNDKEIKDYKEFEKKFLNISMENRFDIRGENLYLLPQENPDTKKLKVLRYGLHLGMLKKNRFEPSHALSHYLKMEDVINEFISEYKDAKLIEMQRIWPHKVKGEGHFVAKIQKLENEDCNVKCIKIKNNDKEIKDYKEFEKKFLNISIENRFDIRGENLYLLPQEHPDTKKLKVLRYGLHLGMLKKNRFEPSHALSHYLKMEDVKNTENFSIEDSRILDYLRGNTIETGKSRGWVLVCVEGICLGWGKESNGILKNHYPKGLRINY